MKLIIDIPEGKWVSIQNEEYCGILDDSLYRSIKNGTPLQSVTNAEEAEAYPINQEENCRIVREFLRDVASIKDLPPCKECRTCIHCKKKTKKMPAINLESGNPLIYCNKHKEYFAPHDTCEFWKEADNDCKRT